MTRIPSPWIAPLAALAALAGPSLASPPRPSRFAPPVTLGADLEPLRTAFAADAGRRRFLALLSPT